MVDKMKGYPLPLGCTVMERTVNFSVAVPEGKRCELLFYKKGKKLPEKVTELPETPALGTVRCMAFDIEETEGYEYNWRIEDEIVPDPYGKAFSGREVWGKERDVQEHEGRTQIVRDTFAWEGDTPLRIPVQNVIAYSLHVRGFTKHGSSKVQHKGTFSGLLEKLPYIKKLGVNQVQCMPVYDFEENLKYTNYWGYGEGYFFAPKAAYACGDPVTEFKSMVKSFHAEGIEVVLEMPFTGETSISMIMDCLRYWVLQYHVDGFIVNPVVIDPGVLRKDPVLAGVKILKKQDYFQNTMRRFLKGDEGMVPDVIWWLRHQSAGEGIFNYMAGHTGFTLYDVTAYDGKHNEANGENNHDGPDYNYSWNCGAEGPSRKKAVTELREKQIRNAFLLLLLAQGTPCILAGDEFANTQKGNNNVYCQDNPVAWLDWNRLAREEALFEFVRKLIAFRKDHKLLYPDREMNGMDRTSCGIPDVSYHGESAWRVPDSIASRQLGVYYHQTSGDGDNCYVAYNMHWLPHEFALPKLPKGQQWYEVVSTEEGVCEEPLITEDMKKVLLKERTIRVLVGK